MGPAPPADRSCATPTPPAREQWSGRRSPPGSAGSERRSARPRPPGFSGPAAPGAPQPGPAVPAPPAAPPGPAQARRRPQAASRGLPAAAPSPCSYGAVPSPARPHRHQPRSPSSRYKILSLPRCLVMATRRSKMAASSFLPCALPLPAGGTAPVYTHHARTYVVRAACATRHIPPRVQYPRDRSRSAGVSSRSFRPRPSLLTLFRKKAPGNVMGLRYGAIKTEPTQT